MDSNFSIHGPVILINDAFHFSATRRRRRNTV